MADATGAAFAVVFIAVLILIGAVVFGYVADLTGDPYYTDETIIAAGCSDHNTSTEAGLCSGTVDNAPIENVTRDAPVVYNCTGATCITLTASTHYFYNVSDGSIRINTDTELSDQVNGTIRADYYQDVWRDDVDNAQQSISSTTYSGFELGMIIAIVIAAVAVVGGVFLIGKRGA